MRKLSKIGIKVCKYNIYIYILNMVLYNRLIGVHFGVTLYAILHTMFTIWTMYQLVKYSNEFDIKR